MKVSLKGSLPEIHGRIHRRRLIVFLLCSGGVALPFIGLAAADVGVDELTRDPVAVAVAAERDPSLGITLHPLTGALSMLGVIAWAAGAAICAFAGAVQRRRGHDPARASFLQATAALLALLGLDDAFQIHEAVAPEDLSIPEDVVYLLLLGTVLAWLWTFRREIARAELGLLGVAFCGFGASLAIDVVGSIPVAIEDTFKLAGIAAFVIWAAAESFAAVAEVEPQPATR